MSLKAELWTRPGDASFGKLVADIPVIASSFTRRANGVGDGTITIPDTYPRIDEILDAPDGASYGGVASLVRIYDGTTLVGEFLPTALIPTQAKGDHSVTIELSGIESILSYGRLEAFDWSGADNEQSLFPDWKFGAENVITDGTFEGLGLGATYELFVADEHYTLSITATGGTFTLTVGGNTSAAIAFDVSRAGLETAIEAITGVTDVTVIENEDGSFVILFKDPENVSPDMTINTGSLTGGSATLTKVYDGFTKTGTTFTVTVDAQTTTAIDWDESALNVENAIQALSTVTEITVDGSGTFDDPWVIVFYDPTTPGSVTVDDTNLSGGTAVLTQVQVGTDSFGSWETSRFADKRVDVAQHGAVSTFQLVSDTISGIGAVTALEFKASKQFGGVQTIVPVTPGGTGQASVWVKSSSGTARYRWVLRAVVDELDNCITGYPSCGGEFTLTANTWTQLTLSDISIPDNVEEMIFRIAYVGTTEPQAGTMRIYGAEYYEGLIPGTLGYILRTLYDDCVSDHGTGDDIYWDNGAGSPYLTLDFSDSVDSDGQTWQDSEIAIEFLHEMPFLNAVTSACAKGGSTGPYEWRLDVNDPDAGTWYLRVYNPGGDADWDLSSDDDCPVVRGGKDTVTRSARKFMPEANDIAYEGASYQIARTRNDAAISALGRRGGYVPDPDVPDLATAQLAAEAALAVRLMSSKSLTYQVIPDASQWRPLVDYLPGYTILVEDAPLVSKSAHRVEAVRFARTSDGAETYEVHFDSESFVGNEAVAQGVRVLLSQFKGIRPDATGYSPRAAGGTIPWLVASDGADDSVKAISGFLCSGADDEETINAALAIYDEVWLSFGNFAITTNPVSIPSGSKLLGIGGAAIGGNGSYLVIDGTLSSTYMIDCVGSAAIENIAISGDSTHDAIYGDGNNANIRISACLLQDCKYGANISNADQLWILGNLISNNDTGGINLDSVYDTIVQGNIFVTNGSIGL